MNKEEAKIIIKDTFENEFDKNKFLFFAINLLKTATVISKVFPNEYVKEVFRAYIEKYEIAHQYTDPEGNIIDVFLVYLKKGTSLERARSAQRNFVADKLKNPSVAPFNKSHSGALVGFISPDNSWRVSFIKLDSIVEVEDNKVKTKDILTPAKRYSFLVGKGERSHTAQEQFFPVLQSGIVPTLKEIEKAFSVETVTNKFFELYKNLYADMKEELDKLLETDEVLKNEFIAKDISTIDFCKKTMGQIVFLYFLQKKGWFGVASDKKWGDGPKNFIRELFIRRQKYGNNFFNDVLEPLFYEALAQDRGRESLYPRLNNCKMPFLNGGLFEPMSGYSWETTNITLKDTLFSNDIKTKDGEVGTGILDVFDRYNFTVNENDPVEKEVAVDPEMLGKVFENLLDVKERKDKGAFYTPREIVHYMCKECLINYLATETDESRREEIADFINHADKIVENDKLFLEKIKEKGWTSKESKLLMPEFVRENAQKIDKLLADVKVCDPAVGSGAFPLGMLNEIVLARNALSVYHSTGQSIYDFKLHAIQHSIHGVDIDSGAVEIAKLRFWLSLIVEDDEPHPLPNMDYKIMQGNSLIEEYEGIKLFDEELLEGKENKQLEQGELFLLEKNKREQGSLFKYEELTSNNINLKLKKDALHKKIQEYITTNTRTAKQNLKDEIDNLKWELIEDTLKEQGKSNKVEEVKLLRKKNNKPFFIWKLEFNDVFQENGGFDIVIGNPPYVRVQNLSHDIIDIYKKTWKTAWKRIDISILFMELGYSLLAPKGCCCYISSNQFITTEYGRMLRKFFLHNSALKTIIDFGDLPVFNALTYVSIFILSKAYKKSFLYNKVETLPFISPKKFIEMEYVNLTDAVWSFGENIELDIIKKMQSICTCLNNYAKCWAGIITGKDDLLMYNINEEIDFIENELLMPVTRAQDCSRYCYSEPSKKVFFPYEDVNNKSKIISLDDLRIKYPKAYLFIMKNETELKNRKDSRKNFGEKEGWYGLIRFGNMERFKRPKLVSPGEVKNNKFSLDLTGSAFSCARVFSITSENIKVDVKYLLAILNSKLLEFYIHKNSSLKQGGYYSYSTSVLDSIPFIFDEDVQQRIIPIIDIILETKRAVPRGVTVALESEIDQMVYELYGLTEDEIRIVESSVCPKGVNVVEEIVEELEN